MNKWVPHWPVDSLAFCFVVGKQKTTPFLDPVWKLKEEFKIKKNEPVSIFQKNKRQKTAFLFFFNFNVQSWNKKWVVLHFFHFPTAGKKARRSAAQHHLSSSLRQDARGAIRCIDRFLFPDYFHRGELKLGTGSPHRMGSSDSSLSYWSRNVLARKKMTPEATNRKPATEAMAIPTTSGSDTYSSQCSPRYHQFSPTRHLAVQQAQLWPRLQV